VGLRPRISPLCSSRAQEYDLRMSRREIATNVLLGLILLVVFAIPVVAVVAAVGYLFLAIGAPLTHYLSRLGLPEDVLLYGFLSVAAIWGGVSHLRKRQWVNAFIVLMVVPVIVSTVFAVVRSPLDGSRFPWIWLVIMVLLPSASSLTRLEFMLSAFVAGGAFAVNTGLLGAGTPARLTTDCVLVGAFILAAVYLRRQRAELASPQAVSSTHA
jgi:hypothetical protein